MTHQMLASNPQYAEFVMAAQQGKLQQPNASKQPSLTKQKTLETLAHQEELTIKQMAAMKDKPMPESGDQMEMMVAMMVEQNKMQDEMHERTGVENDDFEDSLLYFVSKDPEVAQAMQKYMMKMRQSMGMGMPGMPGGM